MRVTNSFGAATSVVASVIGENFVPGPHGFALNFSVGPGSVGPYFGQGAYPDTDNATYTNNFWNNIPAGTLATFRTSIINDALDSSSNASFSGFVLDWGFNNGATSTGGQGTPRLPGGD